VHDFRDQNLAGSRFENVDLSGARFRDVDLRDARINLADLRGVVIRGAEVVDVEISGEVQNLRVNGVDVAPLVEAELDRRDPDRAKMRPHDADGFREAWEVVERRWQSTVDRARRLPPGQVHERVDGEWSFVETLRHLVFATDAWVRRTLLGDRSPWHPWDLPHDEMPDIPGVPRDRDLRPALDEVLDVRAERMGTVREVLESLTDERLRQMTEPVTGPGYPESDSYPVRQCLEVVLSEEWNHRVYVERDLDLLEGRTPEGPQVGRERTRR
jgi:hypothetical protein